MRKPFADDLEADLPAIVRRNTLLLALCMALNWSVVQLVVALSAVTLASLTGTPALAGLGPGIVLISWAFSSLGMGRFMDVRGRVPGIRAGFAGGTAGALIIFAGVSTASAAVFLLGLVVIGAGAGAVNLARTGAADMYPPERRARGISYVLLGAALGAILGPIAFARLLMGVHSETAGLTTPWLIATALMALGMAVTFAIRVDPAAIARRIRGPAGAVGAPTAPTRSVPVLLKSPAVGTALMAAIVAQSVMSAMMSVIGLIMVGHGHDLSSVSLSMSAHFMGMFGLVLVVGQVVDHIGRRSAIVVGFLVLACGVLTLLVSPGMAAALIGMFLIGLGWSIAFVASTVMLADATSTQERAGLMGFTDFAATSMGALISFLGGVLLNLAGLESLALAASVLALVPAVLVLLRRPVRLQPDPR